ncbi:MAG: type 4a pilus biogenesis protein PilO [Candidatus Berkiella sp.]
MNLNLNELDINDIGNWPWVAKGIMILFITLSMIALGVWFDTKKQLTALEQYEKEEQTLKQTFEYKQQQAANLEAYQEQMKMMKASFGALLRQLPEKTEVPGLLEDISHQGLATGLEFRTIRLLPEKEIDFYVELPIEIAVIGTYHQFAEFVSNIASLPRIVTLHDFVIKRLSNEDTNERLMMNITAKTYRYTAEGELDD